MRYFAKDLYYTNPRAEWQYNSKSDPSRSNQRREIRRLTCRLGCGVDMLTLLQLWKWKSARDQSPPVL